VFDKVNSTMDFAHSVVCHVRKTKIDRDRYREKERTENMERERDLTEEK
jgi:hypothetical protein